MYYYYTFNIPYKLFPLVTLVSLKFSCTTKKSLAVCTSCCRMHFQYMSHKWAFICKFGITQSTSVGLIIFALTFMVISCSCSIENFWAVWTFICTACTYLFMHFKNLYCSECRTYCVIFRRAFYSFTFIYMQVCGGGMFQIFYYIIYKLIHPFYFHGLCWLMMLFHCQHSQCQLPIYVNVYIYMYWIR